MFRLSSFPAGDGDCFILSYGKPEALSHILIDGGRANTYPILKQHLAEIASNGERIELLVLSHIDADHIEGLIKLAEDPVAPIQIDEVWFNGFEQMAALEVMGPAQGDQFSRALRKANWKWNNRFKDEMVRVEDDGSPRTILLNSGLVMTILSPSLDKLRAMRLKWANWRDGQQDEKRLANEPPVPQGLERLGAKPMPAVLNIEKLAAVPDKFDTTPPNGSSIAFTAEWEGKRVLLAADAHPDQLMGAIRPLAAGIEQKYRIDLFKVAHHGSLGNTTDSLVALLDCTRFLISTNGTRHGHPDPEAIAKLIHGAPKRHKTLYFNYRQARSTPWNQEKLRAAHDYDCVFPERQLNPLVIDV